MVYGRILYNNIKEYTPKWFPTIPYSQTVKPTFGNPPSIQVANNKSSPSGTPTPSPNAHGEQSVKFSITVGDTSSSSSSWCSPPGPLSTSPPSISIKPITPTEL